MRSFALHTILIVAATVAVLNPAVVLLVTGQRGFALYMAWLDLWLILPGLFAFWYLRRGRPAYFWASIALIVALPPALLAGEIGYSLKRHKYGDRVMGQVPDIHRPDPLLVYTLAPGAVARHTRLGEFDALYVIDERGRKQIERSPAASRSLHVFGDSFTFGFGVSNSETWLNLLKASLGEDIDVLNYGVTGYSLEQMYLSLEQHADALGPGDLVVFAPIVEDLHRGFAAGTHVCGNLILGQIRAEGHDHFPSFENGRWLSADLREHCDFLLDTVLANTRFAWSLGALYRHMRHRARHDAIMASADHIFAAAKALATARGASFQVVFLPLPVECAAGAFSIDLDRLETPWLSLLPHCPESPDAAQALAFPYDAHWNPAGHAWAADALHRVLRTFPDDPTPARTSLAGERRPWPGPPGPPEQAEPLF